MFIFYFHLLKTRIENKYRHKCSLSHRPVRRTNRTTNSRRKLSEELVISDGFQAGNHQQENVSHSFHHLSHKC